MVNNTKVCIISMHVNHASANFYRPKFYILLLDYANGSCDPEHVN